MWPAVCAEAITMQLRVAGCVVIVALVRVLNLAVPLLYRNAVNKLAEVSDLTHPTRGEPKETFSFMNVRNS
jgi:ATP-binding cassette subfamily B (MDR/TAP) protein 6